MLISQPHSARRHVFWILMLTALVGCQPYARIDFEVVTGELPHNARLFVAGNHESLGSWSPRGLELLPVGGIWRGSVSLPVPYQLEFKLTRGTWESEALDEQGRVPPNDRVQVSGSETIHRKVSYWKDLHWQEQPLEERITGTVRRHESMKAEGLPDRDVLVWLPPSYSEAPEKRYPVLYMHDGQQVFDPATSTHRIDWGVDETATRLIDESRIEELLVVAIYNTEQRQQEYSDTEAGERYRRFLVDILKPFIDRTYRTRPGRESTAVMGASMGGLVSFLLIWKHPDIFSTAACLSPAFFPMTIQSASQRPWPTQPIRIYLDNGGKDLDKQLQPGVDQMVALLQEKGLRPGRQLQVFIDPEATHNEAAWAARVWRPLVWFFPPPRDASE